MRSLAVTTIVSAKIGDKILRDMRDERLAAKVEQCLVAAHARRFSAREYRGARKRGRSGHERYRDKIGLLHRASESIRGWEYYVSDTRRLSAATCQRMDSLAPMQKIYFTFPQ